MTCVALDMDETLGHFSQASLLWSAARDGLIACNRDQLVGCLLEIPGLFNPDMPNIIRVLKKGKHDGTVGSVVVYTNNTAPREWPEIVAEAVDRMAGFNLINDVIAGHRSNKKPGYETRRTTPYKTLPDLRRCVGEKARYVFVDNEHHPGMVDNRVDYIRVSPHVITVTPHDYHGALERTLGHAAPSLSLVEQLVRVRPSLPRIGSAFSRDLEKLISPPKRKKSGMRTKRTKGGLRRRRRTRRSRGST